jgi:predicted nucleic-acid-binding protein
MYFADTNLFIRYFTNDDLTKAKAVFDLLQRVKKKEVELWISEVVVVEMVQILSSKKLYNLPREDVKKRIQAILLLENIKIEHKKVYLQALELYTQHNIDFGDCIIAIKVQKPEFEGLYSYDRDFDKIDGVVRIEKF